MIAITLLSWNIIMVIVQVVDILISIFSILGITTSANPSCPSTMIHIATTPMVHSYKKNNIGIMYLDFFSLLLKSNLEMNFSINGRLSCLMTNQMSLSNDSSNALNMIYTILISSTCPPICTNLVVISFTFPTNLIIKVFSSNAMA